MTRDMLKSIMNYYQRREKRLQLRLDSEDSPEEAYRYRRAIRRNRASLNSIEGFFRTDAGSSQENWVTINGTHVLIDENGVAQSGGKLKGTSFKNAKSTPSKKSSQSSVGGRNTGGKATTASPESDVPAKDAKSRVKERFIEQQKFLTNGKYYTIQEALDSEKPHIKKGVAKALGAPEKEAKQAVENGTLNQLIEKYEEKGAENYAKKLEKQLSWYQEGKAWEGSYENLAKGCAEADAKAKEICGDKTISTREYYEIAKSGSAVVDVDDLALQKAYVAGGLGFKAETLNKKMYSGAGELTKAERDFVDMVDRCAVPTSRDVDLYRCVGYSWLDSIAGHEITTRAELKSLEGTVVENKSITSTAPGAVRYFNNFTPIRCKITAPQGTPICPIQGNVSEGELVLPAGTKTRIKSIKLKNFSFPIWNNEQTSPTDRTIGISQVAEVGDNSNIVFVEMEVIP